MSPGVPLNPKPSSQMHVSGFYSLMCCGLRAEQRSKRTEDVGDLHSSVASLLGGFRHNVWVVVASRFRGRHELLLIGSLRGACHDQGFLVGDAGGALQPGVDRACLEDNPSPRAPSFLGP